MQIRNNKEFFFQTFFSFIGLIIFLSILWHNVKNIILNKDNKSISFQNIFTRTIKEYKFSDFDGYINTFVNHDSFGIHYKTIGLVKGKKIIRRIDSYFYSNYDNLREGLTDCNYLGEIKFGWWDSIKMLLNFEVLS